MPKLIKKIKIETMTKEEVQKSSTHSLHALRVRFDQIHSSFFAPGLSDEEVFLTKYAIVVKELKDRKVDVPTREIDRVLFRKALKSKKVEQKEETFSKDMIIIKADEERFVYGIVYEPDEVDTQGDTATEESIRKAAHFYMINTQKIKVNHKGSQVAVDVLESYLAPVDLAVAGRPIKKGTWMLGVRVNDPDIWDQVKAGELQGFSMAGIAHSEDT